MPVIDMTKIRTEKDIRNRIRDFGKAAAKKVKETVDYVKENPQQAMAQAGAVATVFAGATKLVRSVNRHRTLRQEKFHREREIYDPSLKLYLVTNRKLTRKDVDRVNEIKRKTGKRTSEVLSELNLLK